MSRHVRAFGRVSLTHGVDDWRPGATWVEWGKRWYGGGGGVMVVQVGAKPLDSAFWYAAIVIGFCLACSMHRKPLERALPSCGRMVPCSAF